MNGRDQGTFVGQYGTNAERLALDASQIKPLTAYYETDTGNEFKWFGAWVAVAGAATGVGGNATPAPPKTESWTYNTNGSINTYSQTIGGKTYVTTYSYSANGALSGSATV